MIRSVLLLAGLSLVPAAQGVEPFKPYLNCLKSLRICSQGRMVSISSNAPSEVVLAVGSRGGKDGFYAYAEEDAYFYAFPPPPKRPDKPYVAPPPTFWNLYGFVTRIFYPPPPVDSYFYFKLEPGIHDVVYLSFQWLDNPEQPNAVKLSAFTTTPMPGAKITYLPGVGGECKADTESRALIAQETLTRISTVFATFMSAPRPPKGDVSEEYSTPGREMVVTYDKDECAKTLDACMDDDDLKRAAQAQKEKFK